MGLIILYLTGALSLSFLCSVLEAVLLSTPMSFISMKESQGDKTASLMKQYKNNVDRPVGAILSLHFGDSDITDSGAFRNYTENHWCLLLAFVGDAIDQGYPNAYLHHLSVGFALGTHHEGVYAERESRLYEPRGGFGHG